MRGIIGAVIAGAIVGVLGRLILPGRQNISIPITIGIGIVASLVAGIILSLFGYGNSNGGVAWLSWILGAIVAAGGILAYGRIAGKNV